MWERIEQLKWGMLRFARSVRRRWRVFLVVMKVLRMHGELAQLREWARRKRLSGPLAAYERKGRKAEQVIERLRKRYGATVILCEFLLTAWEQVMPQARPKRGAAAKHRSGNRMRAHRQNAYVARQWGGI